MTIDQILKISNQIESELTDRYSDYDLTINQAELLIYFYQSNNNRINATGALTDLGIDKRLMSLALKTLEAKDYIIRHSNPNDKRQKDIELSMSALEVCEDILAIKEEVNAIFESELSVDQLALLQQLSKEL